MSEFDRFVRDYSVPAFLIVVGIVLLITGAIMWGGLPMALAVAGALSISIGLLIAN